VEQLDAYGRRYEIADPADRPALMNRIREVVAPTYESRFHDLLTIDDTAFKQDATS
jgi:hypothetical protein